MTKRSCCLTEFTFCFGDGRVLELSTLTFPLTVIHRFYQLKWSHVKLSTMKRQRSKSNKTLQPHQGGQYLPDVLVPTAAIGGNEANSFNESNPPHKYDNGFSEENVQQRRAVVRLHLWQCRSCSLRTVECMRVNTVMEETDEAPKIPTTKVSE